jgi:FMN phosphatase YigB (HAD superfamily)
MSGSTLRYIFDIDNVIAQTDKVMRRVIADYTGGRVRLCREDIKEFDYYKCQDATGNSITKQDWNPIHELFSKRRYLRLIQPFPGAIEGLHQLAKIARLHLVTTRLPQARRPTVKWLDYYGFPPHDLHFGPNRTYLLYSYRFFSDRA